VQLVLFHLSLSCLQALLSLFPPSVFHLISTPSLLQQVRLRESKTIIVFTHSEPMMAVADVVHTIEGIESVCVFVCVLMLRVC
jgi:hypothetical protein